MKISEEIFKKYLKAGKSVAKTLNLAKKIAKPGAKFLEVANTLEENIINDGCGLAFPINMSLNELAAHYSPIIDDPSIIPEKGLLKIDCGAHFDGYIADAAITINLGNDPGIYQKIVDASEEALKKTLGYCRPGVDVIDIGHIIYKTIKQYELKPISNLGGHGLEQYNLHAGVFIPNTPSMGTSYKLEEGKVYACEPFVTNGFGQVDNGPQITIFQIKSTKIKNINLMDKTLLNKFKEKFKTLPFSPRAIDFIEPKNQISNIVNKFHKMGILFGYNVFIEIGKGLVSQSEHTFIVDKDRPIITTNQEMD